MKLKFTTELPPREEEADAYIACVLKQSGEQLAMLDPTYDRGFTRSHQTCLVPNFWNDLVIYKLPALKGSTNVYKIMAEVEKAKTGYNVPRNKSRNWTHPAEARFLLFEYYATEEEKRTFFANLTALHRGLDADILMIDDNATKKLIALEAKYGLRKKITPSQPYDLFAYTALRDFDNSNETLRFLTECKKIAIELAETSTSIENLVDLADFLDSELYKRFGIDFTKGVTTRIIESIFEADEKEALLRWMEPRQSGPLAEVRMIEPERIRLSIASGVREVFTEETKLPANPRAGVPETGRKVGFGAKIPQNGGDLWHPDYEEPTNG